jgi:hypothetical protein
LTPAAAAALLINRVSQSETARNKLRISCPELSIWRYLPGDPQAPYRLADLVEGHVLLLKGTYDVRPKHISNLTPVSEVHINYPSLPR